jgi:hypothetical protein
MMGDFRLLANPFNHSYRSKYSMSLLSQPGFYGKSSLSGDFFGRSKRVAWLSPTQSRMLMMLNSENRSHPSALGRLVRRGSLVGLLLSCVAGCVTTGTEEPSYGVQSGHEGFVPARIAIMPCQKWPVGTQLKQRANVNVASDPIPEICERFDREVLAGFERQPYMKGFSPKFVRKALESSSQKDALLALPKLWTLGGAGCTEAHTPVACYSRSVSQVPAWNAWLATVSNATRHADAVLLPLVTEAREEHLNIRGLDMAERSLSLELFLVSTNRGELLWAGGRTVRDSTKRLAGEKPLESLTYPAWDQILSLVFNATLWRDFPGRQIL